ncbi:flagellar FlbD family protein [Pelotalea chapellei]|uniref:Flagellar FlbD family protein n=1 Tax=Pelotalea chapellei TaxID=44671 RepID=A0ABS5UC61_9BACT|nr:flagellar FlbD family protein [Pelotalea chapellei]
MIFLTRLDKQQTYLNPDHIVSIEETPDTVITLFNGHHFIVRESAKVIISKIIAFRAQVSRRSQPPVKKHFARHRKKQFRSRTLNKDLCPLDRDTPLSSPFHSQDH